MDRAKHLKAQSDLAMNTIQPSFGMMRLAVLVAVYSLSTFSAYAQGAPNPFEDLSKGADEPIKISADTTVADFNQQTATYQGNVIVEQGEMKLRSDELKIFAKNGTISRIEANGNVVLASPSGSAKSTSAVYEVGPRMVKLTGGVVLTHDDNVMRGSELQVKLASGEARLIAAPGPGGKPGRVQGLFSAAKLRKSIDPQKTPEANPKPPASNP
jgi:lipopolysaccharide export system protein LptA